MEKLTIYRAYDGLEFENEKECLDHEKQLKPMKILCEFADTLPNGTIAEVQFHKYADILIGPLTAWLIENQYEIVKKGPGDFAVCRECGETLAEGWRGDLCAHCFDYAEAGKKHSEEMKGSCKHWDCGHCFHPSRTKEGCVGGENCDIKEY